jgi:hypothetical protein
MPGMLKRVSLGALGGLAGTVVIQTLLIANRKKMPSAVPPISRHPGEFMVGKAKEALPKKAKEHLPEKVETAVAQGMGIGYGVVFGALYAALRPKPERSYTDGAILGLANWAAGYLGWLPASRLMPPVWRQNPQQVLVPAAEHVLYGIATVAAYRRLLNHFG